MDRKRERKSGWKVNVCTRKHMKTNVYFAIKLFTGTRTQKTAANLQRSILENANNREDANTMPKFTVSTTVIRSKI